MRPEAGRRSKRYSTLTASIPRGSAFSPISLLMPLTPPQPAFQKGQKHRHHLVLRDDPPSHRRQETGGLEASLALIAQALPAELGYLVTVGFLPRRPTLGQCPWPGRQTGQIAPGVPHLFISEVRGNSELPSGQLHPIGECRATFRRCRNGRVLTSFRIGPGPSLRIHLNAYLLTGGRHDRGSVPGTV